MLARHDLLLTVDLPRIKVDRLALHCVAKLRRNRAFEHIFIWNSALVHVLARRRAKRVHWGYALGRFLSGTVPLSAWFDSHGVALLIQIKLIFLLFFLLVEAKTDFLGIRNIAVIGVTLGPIEVDCVRYSARFLGNRVERTIPRQAAIPFLEH